MAEIVVEASSANQIILKIHPSMDWLRTDKHLEIIIDELPINTDIKLSFTSVLDLEPDHAVVWKGSSRGILSVKGIGFESFAARVNISCHYEY